MFAFKKYLTKYTSSRTMKSVLNLNLMFVNAVVMAEECSFKIVQFVI